MNRSIDALIKPIRFLLFLVLIGIFLYYSKPVLVPFCIAGILAMLFLPLCRRLEFKGWNRGLSSLVPVVIIVLVLGGVAGLIIWQVQDLTKDLSQIEQKISSFIAQMRNKIESSTGVTHQEQKKMLEKTQQGGGKLTGMLSGAAGSVFSIAVNTVLVIVYIFLFLYMRDHLKNFFLKLSPAEKREDTKSAIHEATKVAINYLSGMAMMIGCLWVLYSIGFSIAGVKYAIFFAILCGLLEIIPFVGNITGTSLTIIVTLVQGGNGSTVLAILAVYAIVQFVQTYILEPMVVGAEVNINPLLTIVAIVVGEAIWGIGGMILAIPLVGIIKIICDHVPSLKPYGFLIGNSKKTEKPGWLEKIKNKFRR